MSDQNFRIMKNLRNIGLILGLVVLISSSSKAQYYYTSYGYAQDWRLPSFINHSIYDNYYGYDIAHVQRYYRHGYRNFNVLLHRNGWFVELRFDQHGHIYRTIRHRSHYPLISHSCTSHCGYHRNYYTTYYPNYHHSYTKVVYVNSHHGHKKHGKHHNNYYTNVHVDKQPNRQSQYNSGSRSAQTNVSRQTTAPQRRSSTVIRTPQRNSTPKVQQKTTSTSNRSRHINTQQAPSRQRVANASRNATAYKSERSSRRDR